MKLLDPALRAQLVCPLCRGELADEPGPPQALVCPPCKRRFPVLLGVPRLVLEESDKL